MTRIALLAGILAAALVVSPGHAQPPLRYWGTQAGTATGLVELRHGEYYEVEPGMEIPGWGRVKDVSDSHLVVEQVRTEAEKRQLRARDAMAYDVLEIHVPRHDLRNPGWDGLHRPRL